MISVLNELIQNYQASTESPIKPPIFIKEKKATRPLTTPKEILTYISHEKNINLLSEFILQNISIRRCYDESAEMISSGVTVMIDPRMGDGVFSIRDISAGTRILKEFPVVFFSQDIRFCRYCGIYLWPLLPDFFGNVPVCECCPTLYCSSDCKNNDSWFHNTYFCGKPMWWNTIDNDILIGVLLFLKQRIAAKGKRSGCGVRDFQGGMEWNKNLVGQVITLVEQFENILNFVPKDVESICYCVGQARKNTFAVKGFIECDSVNPIFKNVVEVCVGQAIYNYGSFFNHSCSPNAFASFIGASLVVSLAFPVTSSDQICISYVDHRSHSNLKNVYDFDCTECIPRSAVTERELNSNELSRAFMCPSCEKEFLAHEARDLECPFCLHDLNEMIAKLHDNRDILKYLSNYNSKYIEAIDNHAYNLAARGEYDKALDYLERKLEILWERDGKTPLYWDEYLKYVFIGEAAGNDMDEEKARVMKALKKMWGSAHPDYWEEE